jgi:hypothetical protein
VHIDVGVARIAADKAGVADGVEHLSRPAMGYLLRRGNEVAGPINGSSMGGS